MLSAQDLDELVFQVLLGRMQGKKRFQKPITEETVIRACRQVKDVFAREPVMLEIDANIVVVGDLHGNIDDLLRIFERMRYPPAMRYIFLGDYVDRGLFGTEILLLLFALKIKFPEHIYMLRGNHETENLSRFYGFYKELTSKYSDKVYTEILEVFSQLPLCAVVGDRIFCVHGGISPYLEFIEDLEDEPKPKDFTTSGILTDMVWSDPSADTDDFELSDRGCGYTFGADALATFLDNNDLDLLVRSHEMCPEGINWPYSDDEENVDRCLTIFSSSNYCGRGNVGAILHISEELLVNVEVFDPLPVGEDKQRHVLLPYWLYDMISKRDDASVVTASPAHGSPKLPVPVRPDENQNMNCVESQE